MIYGYMHFILESENRDQHFYNLDYSRAEARHPTLALKERQGSDPRSCSELPQVGYNEADAVISARP